MSDTHAPETTTPATVTPEHAHELNKHIKGYLMIGGVQILFSIATVIASFAITATVAKTVAVLLAATANGTLVAGILMHLKDEKKTIWKFLIFTGIFFFILFFLTYLARTDGIMGASHAQH